MKQIKNILLIAAAVVIIILLLKYCKGGRVETIETIKIDTVWKDVKGDTFYVPQIVTHYLPGRAPKVFEKWDTLYVIENVDTAEILRDYYSFRTYVDSIDVNGYGRMIISDTISRNRILGRGAKTDLKIPEVTKTITIIERRNQVYIGAGLLGNEKDLAAGYEVNLSLKTKNDRIVEVGYDRLFNGAGYFKIGYRHKLSFRK